MLWHSQQNVKAIVVSHNGFKYFLILRFLCIFRKYLSNNHNTIVRKLRKYLAIRDKHQIRMLLQKRVQPIVRCLSAQCVRSWLPRHLWPVHLMVVAPTRRVQCTLCTVYDQGKKLNGVTLRILSWLAGSMQCSASVRACASQNAKRGVRLPHDSAQSGAYCIANLICHTYPTYLRDLVL